MPSSEPVTAVTDRSRRLADPAGLPSLDELREELEFLADDRDRCDYLIDLGFELPKLDESQKSEETRVHGCQSNVWLVGSLDDGRLVFDANSDAMFVNGLIVVLRSLFYGQSSDAVLDLDLESQMKALDLDTLVTPQRKNGLFGMVQRLKAIASKESASSRGAE